MSHDRARTTGAVRDAGEGVRARVGQWWRDDPVGACAEALLWLLFIVLTFISTDQAIASDRAYPMLLVVLGVAGAGCLVLGVLRRREGRSAVSGSGIGRPGWRALGLTALPFLAMLCWAGITIPFATHVALSNRFGPLVHIRLPMASMVVPLVEAALVVLVAVGLVVGIGRRRLPEALWRAFLVLAASTLISIVWQVATRHAMVRRAVDGKLMWRTSTQLGGQATYHLALLLGIGVAVDAIRRRYRVGVSWLIIAGLGLAIVLSGSRAGLICLGLFCVALFIWGRPAGGRGGGGRRRTLVGVLGLAALAVVAGALLWLRGGALVDHDRAQTWKVAWRAVTADPTTVIVGRGYATIWPWFATETGIVPGAIHGLRPGPFGKSLVHAHNTVVQVGGELGIIGLVLLLVSVVGVAVLAFRGIHGRHLGICLALLASLPALVLDTYLVKNFQVSLVWWLVAAAVAVLMARPADHDQPTNSDQPADRP
ncbi:hypothetical protein [Acidipropionibacterium acidipropionici]|uniref:hypothetical protein n=1 Tax=Acidipropionibacterium acidipropionici TaxID=1748 RepID=UPI0012B63274|nr:hypothetical protein [Acidipropionibacterium acidipropionici]